MKIKTVDVDGKQYAEIQDGKPVYIADDGSETTYDPVSMHQTIGRLNHEAKGHREAKEKLEQQMQDYGDLDPKAAKEAMDKLKNTDLSKMVEAGKADEVRAEVEKVWREKYEQSEARAKELEQQFAQEKIGGAFANSKFIKDNLAIPADMVQATFGKNFKYDSGKLSPVDNDGNPIYSKSNPGEVASFDEALETIVGGYQYRDSILKGSGNSGSGAGPVDSGGKRIITREQFSAMNPADQQAAAKSAGEGKLVIRDN